MTSPTRIAAYVRVSTDEQADSGAGLEAQRAAIRADADHRGSTIVSWHEDAGASAKNLTGRPGLAAAIDAVEAHQADALVVAKLDRLSRSLLDFAELMDRSRRKGWALVALDLGVDTSTPSGEMMASVLAVFAQFERRLIGQRTRDALAVKRSQGVQLGRPVTLDARVAQRVRDERSAGSSYAAIAAMLNADGVPTAHGGKAWHPSTVRKVALRP